MKNNTKDIYLKNRIQKIFALIFTIVVVSTVLLGSYIFVAQKAGASQSNTLLSTMIQAERMLLSLCMYIAVLEAFNGMFLLLIAYSINKNKKTKNDQKTITRLAFAGISLMCLPAIVTILQKIL